jgi:multidrug efflux pump subunit AcrB
MNPATFAIQNRVLTLTLTVLMLVGGLQTFQNLSRLEDPEFTIKDALVITPYPGASATEVEEEVTDELEIAVQQMGQLDEVSSKSDRGLSTLTVTIKSNYSSAELPQVWDELRRKVGDAQNNLPPGAGPSIVVDDYGDVYGVFVAVYGSEYSYAELKQYVDLLKRELLLVEDVAKIATHGERVESIYVELSRDRMARLGISAAIIADELRQKNSVVDAGRVTVGREFIAIEPSGNATTIEQLEGILLRGGDQQIYLRDVATVRRGYVDPPDHMIRYDGNNAIGLGISTTMGGNVVKMGQALRKRMEELRAQTPLGIEFGIVSMQSEAVEIAISGFVLSLLEAVAIVIVVLLLFMGLRSGLLIGFILVVTICGTFIIMSPMGVALERISLGALIIALGMLVDNAIVVVDGMLIRLGKGEKPEEAAAAVVGQTALPLLGATIIAVLAFAAIGTSDDSTGEFCRSLFQVVLASLMLSWVTAVTVTPLLCVMFLQVPAAGSDGPVDPYGGRFYVMFKGLLHGCMRMRWLTVGVVIGLFGAALWGFGYVDQSFFPPSTRPQMLVDFWLPQGTHISETERQSEKLENYLLEREGVTHATSLLGKGGLRFLLTYTPEKLNSAYAQFLVDVDDYTRIDGLIDEIEAHIGAEFPDALGYASKFQLGPGSTGKIQARFSGPDPNVLRELATQTEAIYANSGNAKALRTDWRQRVKVLRPLVAERQANLAGIQRDDVAGALREGFEGARVGLFREGDELLPIIMRAVEAQRSNVASIRNLQIWSPVADQMIPLGQVVSDFETDFEDELVMRLDRRPTLIVFCDPQHGPATKLFAQVRPLVEALELPADYTLEWGGEYEDSAKAQAGLAGSIPLFVLIMVLVNVALFNSLRQTLVIWLNVPLALIGVTAGLLSTGMPFGFMSLLGFLSLIGMLIKNAIVLVDEINLQSKDGKSQHDAIADSAASRLRPVAMAAATTALGMIPLLLDAFFAAMAVTIIAGLVFATILTMIVLPVFFSILVPAAEASGKVDAAAPAVES